jgi:DNA-binding NarL/FixJ family response regulator
MPFGRDLRGCSVLVLEDVYMIAEELRRILVTAGAEVVGPFSDAALGIAAADKAKPSCALIDINLGAGASFAPAKALRARGVPLAFITGYGADAVPPELADAPHLQKPAKDEDVVGIAHSLCASSHQVASRRQRP